MTEPARTTLPDDVVSAVRFIPGARMERRKHESLKPWMYGLFVVVFTLILLGPLLFVVPLAFVGGGSAVLGVVLGIPFYVLLLPLATWALLVVVRGDRSLVDPARHEVALVLRRSGVQLMWPGTSSGPSFFPWHEVRRLGSDWRGNLRVQVATAPPGSSTSTATVPKLWVDTSPAEVGRQVAALRSGGL